MISGNAMSAVLPDRLTRSDQRAEMPRGAAFLRPTGPFITIEAFEWTIRDFATTGAGGPVLRSEVFDVLGDSW